MECCPICTEEIVWYGEKPRPPGPCLRCIPSLPKIGIISAQTFMEFVEDGKNLKLTRRGTVMVVPENGKSVHRDGIRMYWETVCETEDGWARLTFTEYLPQDDYGNLLRDPDSVWMRVRNSDISYGLDRSASGSF